MGPENVVKSLCSWLGALFAFQYHWILIESFTKPSMQRCGRQVSYVMASVACMQQHGTLCQCERLCRDGLSRISLSRRLYENCSQTMSRDWPGVDQSREIGQLAGRWASRSSSVAQKEGAASFMLRDGRDLHCDLRQRLSQHKVNQSFWIESVGCDLKSEKHIAAMFWAPIKTN